MGSKKLNMKTIVALLFITIIQSSLSIGVFGTGQAPQSSCRSDRDCPRLYSGPGRCLTSRGGWCNYRKCASCLNDVDCSYNRRCSRGSCVRKDACYSDFDCYNGQTCDAGRCIKDRKRY